MMVLARTLALFVALAGLFALLGVIIGYFFENMWLGVIIMLAFSLILNMYAYFFSKRIVLKRQKVKIVTEAENPRLYRVVKDTAGKAGLPMPEVGIINNPSPNAFATGRNPKNAAVVATTGLLSLLNDDELEGVMAHELAHVKNRDILVMSVAAAIAGMISFIATHMIWIAMFSGNRKDNGLGLAVAVISAITLPLAAMLVQLGISRGREFGADKKGAEFTGKPLALASALRKLDVGISSTPIPKGSHNDSYADSHLWIEAPVNKKKKGRSSMFSTHPDIQERIRRLEAQAGKYTVESNPFL